MDKFKDKIIGYKTYYFNMIFSQNTKIILQNHIQIRFYIRKQEKLGYKKALREGELREWVVHCFFPRR